MFNELVNELVEKIKKYAQEYYIDGNSSISDAEFDELVEILRALDPNNQILHVVGWGCKPVSDTLLSREHRYRVDKFDYKVKESKNLTIPMEDRVVTVKLDGGSIIAYYVDGKFDYALTRGDGLSGFDVSNKIKALVPNKLTVPFTGAVRGEIIIPNDIFNEKYAKDYKSVRNLAVGMIKRDNLSFEDLSSLRLVCYKAQGFGLNLKTKIDTLNWLADEGFTTVDRVEITDYSDENLRDIIKSYDKYLIDGLIITTNTYEELEDGSFRQIDEQAYKTSADSVEVEITDIQWNMSRTGKFIPVIVYPSTMLSGASCSRATAFNARFVKEQGLGVGAVVEIKRSGEIIPNCENVITPVTPDLVTKCPVCGEPPTWVGANLYCNNPNCENKSSSDLYHWIFTIAPIKNLGLSAVSSVLEHFNINTIKELYRFNDWDKCYEVEGIGGSTVNLLKEMGKKLRSGVEFKTFLMACNINGLGWRGSLKLCTPDFKDALICGDDGNLVPLLEKSKVNKTIRAGVIDKIAEIRDYANLVDIFIEEPKEEEPKDSIVVCLTGKLSVSRGKFLEEIKPFGFIEGSISKARYLITDNPNSGSSKNKQAAKLKADGKEIDVVSETWFRDEFKIG